MSSEIEPRPTRETPAEIHPASVRNNMRSVIGAYPHMALEALASLKFTVALFALSIFLILAGTVAQAELDIHEVLNRYFRTWFAYIEFNLFFPKTIFQNPDTRPQPGGGIWFPGGATIGTALFLNLLAAHAIRFRVQARGSRLWAGLGVVAGGVFATWLVIKSGSNPDGFQATPIFDWDNLWKVLKFGLGVAWVGLASSLLKIRPERKLERWTIVGLTVMLGVGLAALLLKGGDAQPDPSSMRILWQLLKAEFAAGALLAGCILVFKKRAGVVLLHGGLGLMMMSELVVATLHHESQMPLMEGETVNYTVDHRTAELAIVDHSPEDHSNVVVVPQERLTAAAGKDAGRNGLLETIASKLGLRDDPVNSDVVEHESLPFQVKVLDYYINSRYINRIPPGETTRATHGAGVEVTVEPAEKSTGTDSEINMPAAWVELLDRETSESLGVYLVTPHLLEQDVVVDGRKYEISLRFKQTYKPYSMHLIEARGDTYIGTDTVKDYSSDLQLVDEDRGTERTVKIWMNNPLRYAGETFYQADYRITPVLVNHVDPSTNLRTGIPVQKIENGRRVVGTRSTLQVVKNTGWMIPYVACMIVATGMLFHFWIVLMRFLNRRNAGQVADGNDPARPEFSHALAGLPEGRRSAGPTDEGGWRRYFHSEVAKVWLPLAVAVLTAGWMFGKLYRAASDRVPAGKMDVKSFSQLPSVSEGRIKPMDSLARNALRGLSEREVLDVSDDNTMQAIDWMLEHVTHPEAADRYRVFRVTNLETLNLLGLPRRKGFRYSYSEIAEQKGSDGQPNIDKIRRQAGKAHAVDSKQRNVFHRKIIALYSKVQSYWALRYSHQSPPEDVGNSQVDLLRSILLYAKEMRGVPFSCPVEDAEGKQWQTLTIPATRMWVRKFAESHQLETHEEVVRALLPHTHDRDIRKTAEPELYGELARRIPDVPPLDELKRDRPREWKMMYERLAAEFLVNRYFEVMGSESLDAADPPQVERLAAVFEAYRDGEVEAFNTAVSEYQTLLDEQQPERYEPAKLGFEAKFNRFSPYLNAAVLYIAAFVLSVLAWLGWSKPLNRSAFGLILLAFAVHTVALAARMYVSGRWGVTVTNLYSSAVFIGWAACLLGIVLEVVFRIGIGNVVASAIGFGTLLIAHYLSFDGDTIAVMQAVLDTNFWLATHVTTITLGYATTYVAGVLGLLYIGIGVFSRLLNADFAPHKATLLISPALYVAHRASHFPGGGNFGKTLHRMTYGTLCFSIFFSFVGTVLGGLWADDSWGRFWGWDPKENGALIIVLWNALVLHARWGGMVRERGMAVLAVAGNIVTSWSWFGVNLLSVGLHSYGFQEGVGYALALFVASQLICIGVGCLPKDLWRSFRTQAE